jgi:SAM-dependent methyltransferase
MKTCQLCQKPAVMEFMDCGKQPVAHRFLASPQDEEYVGPLVLGQCQHCALVQQTRLMPVEELVSPYEWIARVEPERHLDDLVQRLARLPGITKESAIWGVSWKENTTLARFNKLGFNNTRYLKPDEEFGITDPLADVETVQHRMTVANSHKIVARHGKADIVIVRQLLEHAYDVREFLKALKNFLKPSGYLVVEIPDCRLGMEYLDYTTIWEEHTLYLTPVTFRSCFAYGGFKLVDFIEEEYSVEYSYIGIAQIADKPVEPVLEERTLGQEFAVARNFAGRFEGRRREIREHLGEFKKNQGKIALFGAVHRTCAFLNFMPIQDLIEFVVDDNPHKAGMFMPGARVPILPAKELLARDIKLCLLGINVVNEGAVVSKNQEFVNRGGVFKSIFPRNALAFDRVDSKI